MAETEIVKKLIDINGEQCVSESEAMSKTYYIQEEARQGYLSVLII